jgi:hypothetical protein
MRSISRPLAAAGVAGALLLGALPTAASAQTWGWNGYHNAWNGYSYGGYYGEPYGSAYGGGVLVGSPVAGRFDGGPYVGVGVGVEAPVAGPYGGVAVGAPYANTYGYRLNRTCVTDEGYGRYQLCDHGGGF